MQTSPVCVFKKSKCHRYHWPQVNHVSSGVLQNKPKASDEATFKTIPTSIFEDSNKEIGHEMLLEGCPSCAAHAEIGNLLQGMPQPPF